MCYISFGLRKVSFIFTFYVVIDNVYVPQTLVIACIKIQTLGVVQNLYILLVLNNVFITFYFSYSK